MNFIIFILFFSINFCLFGQTNFANTTNTTTAKNQEVFKANLKILENHLNEQRKSGKYTLMNQIVEEEDCHRCPKHLTLITSINKVLEKMQNEPEVKKKHPRLPHQITKLKFLYYSVKSKNLDGLISCQNIGYEPILNPHQRMNGDSEFVFEDVFKYETVDGFTIYSPSLEETTYYYRGDGDEKDLIIEAKISKDRKTTFKFYKYIPSEEEMKFRNLPDLGEKPAPKVVVEAPILGIKQESESNDSANPDKNSPTQFKVNFDPKLEMRHKILPKDFKIGTASVSHQFTEEVRVEAQTEVSLAKGNKTKIDLQNGGKSEAVVELSTSLSGETKYAATVPYEIKVPKNFFTDADLKVHGAVTERTENRSVSFFLTDNKVEVVRADLNQDKNTGNTSAVLTRTLQLDSKSNVVLQAGAGNQSTFVSAKHSQKFSSNVGAVLDIRYDANKKASLFYSLSARF